MTEDAIYAELLKIGRELGEQSGKLDAIDGRLDKGDTRMGRIERKLDGRPCISQQGPCPTQQVDLPSATDAAIGRAARWTAGKLWTAIPHLWRTLIIGGGGAALGVALPYLKGVLLWLAQRL